MMCKMNLKLCFILYSLKFIVSCYAVTKEELEIWRENVQDHNYKCPVPEINEVPKDIPKILEVVDCDDQGALFRYDYKVNGVSNFNFLYKNG